MTSDSALPFVPVEEIAMNGLRVAFARGVPGAVKAILGIKGIEHIPLPQDPGGSSEIMKDWTGQTSAPVVMFNDDKARPHGSKMLA